MNNEYWMVPKKPFAFAMGYVGTVMVTAGMIDLVLLNWINSYTNLGATLGNSGVLVWLATGAWIVYRAFALAGRQPAWRRLAKDRWVVELALGCCVWWWVISPIIDDYHHLAATAHYTAFWYALLTACIVGGHLLINWLWYKLHKTRGMLAARRRLAEQSLRHRYPA